MTFKLKLLSIGSVLILVGCGTWVKPGATQQDFASDRYECMRDSRSQGGYAYVNPYGGYAVNGPQIDGNLFASCMNSKGWYLQR